PKVLNESGKYRVLVRRYSLYASSMVARDDGWDPRNRFALARKNFVHPRRRLNLFEIVIRKIEQHAWREWLICSARLERRRQSVMHVGSPRIGKNGAIAERTITKFHAALKPAHDGSVGDFFGCEFRGIGTSFVPDAATFENGFYLFVAK